MIELIHALLEAFMNWSAMFMTFSLIVLMAGLVLTAAMMISGRIEDD